MCERTKIREIFFMSKEGGLLFLHVPYIKEYIDPVLTAAFISAIGTFAKQGVGKLEKVGREKTDLIMLEGEHIVLAAIVTKGMGLSEFSSSGAVLLEKFEEEYQWQILKADGILNGYYKFIFDVYQLLPIYNIEDSVVFERTDKSLEDFQLRGLLLDELTTLMEAINGIRAVKDILGTTWHIMSRQKVLTLLGLAYYFDILKVKRNVEDQFVLKFVEHDMFGQAYPRYMIEEMLITMYNAFGEEQMNMLLPLCDGTKTVSEISTELHVGKEIVVFVTSELIKLGALVYLEKSDLVEILTEEYDDVFMEWEL